MLLLNLENGSEANEAGQGIERKSQSSKEVKDKNGGILEKLAGHSKEMTTAVRKYAVESLQEMRDFHNMGLYDSDSQGLTPAKIADNEQIEVQNVTHATQCADDLQKHINDTRNVLDCIDNTRKTVMRDLKMRKALSGDKDKGILGRMPEHIKERYDQDKKARNGLQRALKICTEGGDRDRSKELKKLRTDYRLHLGEVEETARKHKEIVSERLNRLEDQIKTTGNTEEQEKLQVELDQANNDIDEILSCQRKISTEFDALIEACDSDNENKNKNKNEKEAKIRNAEESFEKAYQELTKKKK